MAPLHQVLWAENQDLARAALEHEFVRALGDGSLQPEVFCRYVAQDVFFLMAFARSYALAAARCRRREDLEMFHRLLGGALEELGLHRIYAAKLGVEIDRVRPYQETLAYTDFLAATAWGGDLGEILAAMTPCMRLYSYLGCELAAACEGENPYRNWIETYSSQSFAALAATLENLLDHHADDNRRVRGAYRYAMRCEVDFFSASYGEHTAGGRG